MRVQKHFFILRLKYTKLAILRLKRGEVKLLTNDKMSIKAAFQTGDAFIGLVL